MIRQPKKRGEYAAMLAIWIGLLLLGVCGVEAAPVRIIFDTDVGNDVDDVLALSMLHALQTRGECELLAVTITKPDELAGPFVDAVNTFYGRPGIPIGFTHAKLTNEPSKFLPLAEVKDGGKLRYPHHLSRSSKAPEATAAAQSPEPSAKSLSGVGSGWLFLQLRRAARHAG
jgi:hypothetical protein